jgi:hypothetical protein
MLFAVTPLAEAKLLGYDSGQYDLDVVVYTGGPGTFGGLGYVGSRGIWLKSLTDWRRLPRTWSQLRRLACELLEHQRCLDHR